MIIYSNIVQGTEAWERIRYGKIGGTRSGGLFTKTDSLLIDLLSEHTEPYAPDYDSFESYDMVRGHELEPRARMEIEQYAGVEFLEAGWWQCEENHLMGISPDGFTSDKKIACEIKCPAAKKHTIINLWDGIHPDYTRQCVHYFTVNPDLERLYFASYRPENQFYPLVIRMITRDGRINLGTEKTPVMKTVAQWVAESKAAAKQTSEKLAEMLENLSMKL